jgi:glycine cleavage system H protein
MLSRNIFTTLNYRFYSTLRYTVTQEWIKTDIDEKIGEIGITNKAQEEMGEIVYLDFSDETQIIKGDIIANIESVKTAAEIISPVSGIIIERNNELLDTPNLLNKNPMNSWLCKIQLSNKEELEILKIVE